MRFDRCRNSWNNCVGLGSLPLLYSRPSGLRWDSNRGPQRWKAGEETSQRTRLLDAFIIPKRIIKVVHQKQFSSIKEIIFSCCKTLSCADRSLRLASEKIAVEQKKWSPSHKGFRMGNRTLQVAIVTCGGGGRHLQKKSKQLVCKYDQFINKINGA